MVHTDGEHAADYIEDPNASIARYALPKSVWVHGQLVPRYEVADFLRRKAHGVVSVPCRWRAVVFRGGGE